MSLDITELEPTTRGDFRRANGAPQIVDKAGKNQRFSRPSSYAKPLDDESALVNWKIDRACIGVSHDRAIQARWVALDPDDENSRSDKAALREASISAGRGAEAADIGTALHAMSVRWEQDPKFSPPEPYLSSLTTYERELTRLGLRSTHFEFHTVNEQYRTAGTGDRIYETSIALRTPDGELLPPGTLLVGDLKTGGKLEYSMPSYAVQVCLYAEGEFYDVVEDTFIDTPPINQDWAILVHMPASEPGVCEMLWVDLEVGRWGCYLVDQIKRWRKMWRSREFDMPPVDAEYDMRELLDEPPAPLPPDEATIVDGGGEAQPTPVSQPEPPPPEVTEPASEPLPPESHYGLSDWVAWFKARLNYIADNERARKRLQILWPTGTPTPKQGIAEEHVAPIHRLLSQIESEFSLTFVEGGPPSTGPRRSSTTRKG